MRHPIFALILMLALPCQAQHDDTKKLGTGGDDAALIREMLASYKVGEYHTIRLPAGQLKGSFPVVVGPNSPNVSFLGAGVGQTNIYVDPGLDAFVPGQLDPANFDATGRPDLFGLLDTSIAPTAGIAFGFDTQGHNYIVEKGAGLSFGGFSKGSWDYWENATGFTIGFAIGGTPGTGIPLMGTGGYQAGALGPYATTGNPGEVWINYRLAGDTNANRAIVLAGFDFSGARKVNRCQLAVDFTAGIVTAFVNGVPTTPTYIRPPDSFVGQKLIVNDRDARFSVGGGLEGPVTPFQLLALTMWNAPVTTWGDNDAARYPSAGPGVIGGFNPFRNGPGRLMFFTGGDAAAPGGSYGVVLDANTNGQSTSGTVFKDFSVHNGGIALAGVLDTDLDTLDCEGGRAGLDVFPGFVNYRLRTRNCVFGGDTAAVKLYETLGTMDSPRLTTGGMSSVVETSCSVIWNQPFFGGFGPNQKRAVDLLSGMYAGNSRWVMPTIDAETPGTFSNEIFRCENTVGCVRTLTVIDGAAGGTSPTGVVFRLIGVPASPTTYPAKIYVSGFGMTPCAGSVDCQGVPGQWIGNVDQTQCPYLAGPSGSGFDAAKMIVAK